MRKFLEILLWLLGGVGVLLLALVALLFFVDVDHFRPQIEQQVSNALGRDVILNGPLELEPSLTPRIAVHGDAPAADGFWPNQEEANAAG